MKKTGTKKTLKLETANIKPLQSGALASVVGGVIKTCQPTCPTQCEPDA